MSKPDNIPQDIYDAMLVMSHEQFDDAIAGLRSTDPELCKAILAHYEECHGCKHESGVIPAKPVEEARGR